MVYDISLYIQIAGLIFELLGALLIAGKYTGMTRCLALPKVLASAIVGGKIARGVADLGEITKENRRLELRGLGFLALGFSLQIAGMIVQKIG